MSLGQQPLRNLGTHRQLDAVLGAAVGRGLGGRMVGCIRRGLAVHIAWRHHRHGDGPVAPEAEGAAVAARLQFPEAREVAVLRIAAALGAGHVNHTGGG